jgi:flagellar motor component MotA
MEQRYIFENTKELIDKIVNYSNITKSRGILETQDLQSKEKNPFLAHIMLMIIDNFHVDDIEKNNRIFIKYYKKDIDSRETIIRQMKMILDAALGIANNDSPLRIAELCYCYYPAEKILHTSP